MSIYTALNIMNYNKILCFNYDLLMHGLQQSIQYKFYFHFISLKWKWPISSAYYQVHRTDHYY